MRNVAANKSCDISTRYEEVHYIKTSGDCSAAINGNNNTHFNIMDEPPNCIHTSDQDPRPYWMVDLTKHFAVHRIIIYGRDNYEHRMDCVHIWLDKSEIFTFPCPGTKNVTNIIDLNPPKQGQVVMITRGQASPGEPMPFLNICEVEIWVCLAGWWGSNCQNPCGQTCQATGQSTGQGEKQDNYCDSDNDICRKECAGGHYSVSNDCLNTCGSGCDGGTCDKSNGICQCRPGWEAPLCHKCADGHYSVSNDCQNTCGSGCDGNTCDKSNGTCQCRPGWESPLCQKCAGGHYSVSNDCQSTCGSGCYGGTCDKSNGTCQCRPGWESPLCQNCLGGYYVSSDCQNTCGGGCNDTCSRTDGTCRCRPGWQPPLCQRCSADHYNESNDCQNTCGEGCHDTCNRTDGTCQCRTGWQPPLCRHCSTGHWGDDCSKVCGHGCKNGTCNVHNGTCECKSGWAAASCAYCSRGHYNMSNDCQNTCGEGCYDTCNTTDGSCQCRRGWEHSLCQNCSNGYYNISNDCQNTCGEGCHDTCSRIDGTCQCRPGWQPPLCQHCIVGYWGDICTHLCGPGCQEGVCEVVHGTCECKKGWKMPVCEDCTDGHYNVFNDCQNICGEGCHDTCSRTDGTCQCQLGWEPPLCQWCADGWFGSECTKCGHCANNSVCDKKTGVCPFCDGDFVAPLCLNAVTTCNDVKDSYSVAGPVAGAAVGAGIVFFILGAIFGWWLRRSRSNQPSQTDYSHEGFSTMSNLGSSALSLKCLPERPGRPESPKDRSEDTSDYGIIGFNSDVYEKSVVSDNEKTAYTPLHFHMNSENTDTSDYINASVR